MTTADIQIARTARGRGYRLEAAQFLPRPRERLFELFSDAFQLEKLTPPWLEFSVLTPAPIKIAAGTIIAYRLKLRGLPVRWQSVIDVWEPPARFVDRQLRGPYRRWSHEHLFELVPGGTLCRDIVDYDVIGGMAVHALYVRPDLLKIFTFRQETLRQMFPASDEPLLA